MTQFPHDTIQAIKEQLGLALGRTKGSKGDFRATFGVEQGQPFARLEFLVILPKGDPEIITNLPAVKKLLLTLIPADSQGNYQDTPESLRLHFSVEKQKTKKEQSLHAARTGEMKAPVDVFSSGVQIKAEEKRRQEVYQKVTGTTNPEVHNNTSYGRDLATKFANRLMSVGMYGNSHRDYCGMGFVVQNGTILYVRLWDGALTKPEDILKKFSSKENFITWLAKQSDQSLSQKNDKDEFYRNNQTITLLGLMSYVGA